MSKQAVDTSAPRSCALKSYPCRGRVLVVDDEEHNRVLLRDSLEVHHYDIIEAEDGFSALQKIAECPPDVVLLDLMMPGMDGFEVCRRIKEAQPAMAVLLVTALSERKERLMGIAAGASDFLSKPVDIQDVILRVGNAVHAKRLLDALELERCNSERLLLNVLPRRIAERMKGGETNIAEKHPEATILVADLVGFTSLSAHIAPEEVVHLLSEVFSGFDILVGQYGVEKIKTIGDAYMVAGGIDSTNSGETEAVADLAFAMHGQLEKFNASYNTSLSIRIGISCGPVIAGVIGHQRFAYDVWGDTVNIACRLESQCLPGKIYVSEPVYERIKDKYRFGVRMELEAKGGLRLGAYQL